MGDKGENDQADARLGVEVAGLAGKVFLHGWGAVLGFWAMGIVISVGVVVIRRVFFAFAYSPPLAPAQLAAARSGIPRVGTRPFTRWGGMATHSSPRSVFLLFRDIGPS